MSSVDDLGTAAQCIAGARQSLRRVVDADVDDALSRSAKAVIRQLDVQEVRVANLINWRREVER